MGKPLRRFVAVSLVLCLLLLSGLIYAQTVPHTFHHARHQAATHATVLCSWMCSAGQAFEGTAVAFQSVRSSIGVTSVVAIQEASSTVRSTALTRGPPSLSV